MNIGRKELTFNFVFCFSTRYVLPILFVCNILHWSIVMNLILFYELPTKSIYSPMIGHNFFEVDSRGRFGVACEATV
jgi:hypothetical protein